jgi:hypothetical protein
VFNIYFPDQRDPKSPWHEERVRRAASLAIDRDGLNLALTLGHSLVTGNPVVADNYEFFWQPPAPVYDPEKPNSCSPRQVSPRASMAVIITATRPTPTSARPCSTTFKRSVSG